MLKQQTSFSVCLPFSLVYSTVLSSVVNMTVQFGETLHILWQCVPYALEAVAIIQQPAIYSHSKSHSFTVRNTNMHWSMHAYTLQTNKCNAINWGQARESQPPSIHAACVRSHQCAMICVCVSASSLHRTLQYR